MFSYALLQGFLEGLFVFCGFGFVEGDFLAMVESGEAGGFVGKLGGEVGDVLEVVFKMQGVDVEGAGLSVGFGVEAGDESVAPEDGENEVAVFAFGSGDVAFESVVEIEEFLDARVLDDQVVEGVEEMEAGFGFAEASGFFYG